MFSTEEQIRKEWLIAFYVWVLWSTVGLLVGGYTLFSLSPPDPDFPIGKGWLVALYAIMSPLVIGSWWATYHYSYSKQGIGWLLFLIVSFIFTAIIEPISWLEGIPSQLVLGLFSRPFEVIQWLVTLYFLFACYRLYQINLAKAEIVDAKTTDAFNTWADTLAAKPRTELTFKEKLVVARDQVRQHWFVAYGLLVIAGLCGLLYLIVRYAAADFAALGMYQGSISWFLYGSGLLWASFYFPYQRRGTKWLIFLIVQILIAEIAIVALAYAGVHAGLLFAALIVLTYVGGALFSWLMVNKARKQFEQKS